MFSGLPQGALLACHVYRFHSLLSPKNTLSTSTHNTPTSPDHSFVISFDSSNRLIHYCHPVPSICGGFHRIVSCHSVAILRPLILLLLLLLLLVHTLISRPMNSTLLTSRLLLTLDCTRTSPTFLVPPLILLDIRGRRELALCADPLTVDIEEDRHWDCDGGHTTK